jgi:hypothetical protein
MRELWPTRSYAKSSPGKATQRGQECNTRVALQTLSGLLFRCSRNALVGCEEAAIMAEPVCQKGVVRGFLRNPMIS